MSQNQTLASSYNNSSRDRVEAMRIYLDVAEQRKATPVEYEALIAEDGLVKLGPYMPGLASNPDLTLQDKKFFYMLYIKLLEDVGDTNAAINCCEAAITLDSSDTRTLSRHATLLKSAGRYDEAIESLQKGISQDPKDKFLLTALGDSHRANGDHEIAKDCYRRVSFIDPQDNVARRRLETLERKPF